MPKGTSGLRLHLHCRAFFRRKGSIAGEVLVLGSGSFDMRLGGWGFSYNADLETETAGLVEGLP